VVDELKQDAQNGLAFVYCKHGDDSLTYDVVVRSILRQLSVVSLSDAAHRRIFTKLEMLYHVGTKDGARLKPEDSTMMIQKIIDLLPMSTIVIDGLDACRGPEQTNILRLLTNLALSGQRVKIFATSWTNNHLLRDERERLTQANPDSCQSSFYEFNMSREGHGGDLERVVRKRLRQPRESSADDPQWWSRELREKTVQRVVSASKGL
jgi:hypothetical protein